MKKEVKNRGESFKWCYKTSVLMRYVCEFQKSAYLCTVFFIVLDLRLTKVGARRCSFFYVYMSRNGDIVDHTEYLRDCLFIHKYSITCTRRTKHLSLL